MSFVVIGVDPGLKSGVAVFDSRRPADLELHTLDFDATCAFVDSRLVDESVPVDVVGERYTIGGRRPLTNQPDALELLGVLRWLAFRHEVRHYRYGASDAQRVGGRDVLRRLGWYRPVRGDHLEKAANQVVVHLHSHYPRLLADMLGI